MGILFGHLESNVGFQILIGPPSEAPDAEFRRSTLRAVGERAWPAMVRTR